MGAKGAKHISEMLKTNSTIAEFGLMGNEKIFEVVMKQSKVQDKMNYLSTHGEYPELQSEYDSPLTMILERDEAIQKITENMWGSPL